MIHIFNQAGELIASVSSVQEWMLLYKEYGASTGFTLEKE